MQSSTELAFLFNDTKTKSNIIPNRGKDIAYIKKTSAFEINMFLVRPKVLGRKARENYASNYLNKKKKKEKCKFTFSHNELELLEKMNQSTCRYLHDRKNGTKLTQTQQMYKHDVKQLFVRRMNSVAIHCDSFAAPSSIINKILSFCIFRRKSIDQNAGMEIRCGQ